jgi:hypothetical protein
MSSLRKLFQRLEPDGSVAQLRIVNGATDNLSEKLSF